MYSESVRAFLFPKLNRSSGIQRHFVYFVYSYPTQIRDRFSCPFTLFGRAPSHQIAILWGNVICKFLVSRTHERAYVRIFHSVSIKWTLRAIPGRNGKWKSRWVLLVGYAVTAAVAGGWVVFTF